MKIILFTGCDDGFVPLLLDMMESLGKQLQKYDFGLLDLGLSEANKKKIRKLKPEVIIKEPKKFIKLPKNHQTIFADANIARPFIKEIFEGYDGYMQVDADLWFLDNSVIDDYIKAAEKTGFSVATETHDSLRILASRIRFTEIFGMTFMRGIKSYNYNMMNRLFGTKEAVRYALSTPINNGLYFIHADSPIWEKWQEVMKSVKWHKIKKSKSVSSQTSLLYALNKYNLPHTLLTIHYNWILHSDKFILDKKKGKLFDQTYPHQEIKVVHLVAKTDKEIFNVKTTDDKIIKTKLIRSEFLKAIS